MTVVFPGFHTNQSGFFKCLSFSLFHGNVVYFHRSPLKRFYFNLSTMNIKRVWKIQWRALTSWHDTIVCDVNKCQRWHCANVQIRKVDFWKKKDSSVFNDFGLKAELIVLMLKGGGKGGWKENFCSSEMKEGTLFAVIIPKCKHTVC